MPSYAAIACAEGPNGLFATLESSRLVVRCAETKLLLRNIDLDPRLASSVRHLRWFKPGSGDSKCERLLLATTENVYVYEVQNHRWTATVKKICGDGSQIAHVDFGSSEDEVLAYSMFGMKVSLCSLATGSTVEVRDPKSPAIRSHSLRKSSGHLAVLTRPAAKDVLTLLKPVRKDVEYSVTLPTTDAQGIRWSPDGQWLAVWDAATVGSSLLIYTATGQLFKKLSGGANGEDLGYGIQRIEWDRETRYLAVAANEGKIILLTIPSFRPAVALEYPSVVGSGHAAIHEEQIASDGHRAYGPAQQPASPPANPSALGFNHLSIAPSADLLACVPAKMPSTVWIHSIHPNPQLTAVLIHHGNVKQIMWHPHHHGLLLIYCTSATSKRQEEQSGTETGIQSGSQVFIWGYDLAEPLVIPVQIPDGSPVTKVTWLNSALKTQAMISSASTCSLVSVLDLEADADDEGDFPTPKPTSRTKAPTNVNATPAAILGYDDETPATAQTNASTFSPVKMDTAQLTRTLGFQFTSLNDADADDTFDFKRTLRSHA